LLKGLHEARIRARQEKEKEKEKLAEEARIEAEEREYNLSGWSERLKREHEVRVALHSW